MTTNTLILTLPCSIPSFYLAYKLYKKNFLGQIFNKQFAITLIISGKICVVILSTIIDCTVLISPGLLQEQSHHTPWHSRWMDFSWMRGHQGSHFINQEAFLNNSLFHLFLLLKNGLKMAKNVKRNVQKYDFKFSLPEENSLLVVV